jgi:site-specific DNA-methyltransferase (adenine-specific)
VKSLSYEGAVVLDFFAGSGTTGAVCIEENRHSIMVDSDPSLKDYFMKHLQKLDTTKSKPYEVLKQVTITDYLNKVRTE